MPQGDCPPREHVVRVHRVEVARNRPREDSSGKVVDDGVDVRLGAAASPLLQGGLMIGRRSFSPRQPSRALEESVSSYRSMRVKRAIAASVARGASQHLNGVRVVNAFVA
jgi:hypothetical protein